MTEASRRFEDQPLEVDKLHLGDILDFPEVTPIETGTSSGGNALPPTTLESSKVKDILAGVDSEKIARLLVYAWDAGTLIDRPVPSHLLPQMPENLPDWLEKHLFRIDRLLEMEREKIAEIYDTTDIYSDCSLLRNASSISDIAWNHGYGAIGTRLELGARLLLYEAI